MRNAIYFWNHAGLVAGMVYALSLRMCPRFSVRSCKSWKVPERYQSLVTTTVFRGYQSINSAILIIFQSASVLIVVLITYRALSTSTPSLAVRTNENHYTGIGGKVKQQKRAVAFTQQLLKSLLPNQSGAAARFATRFRIGYRFSMVLCMLSEFRSPQYIAVRAGNILFSLHRQWGPLSEIMRPWRSPRHPLQHQ